MAPHHLGKNHTPVPRIPWEYSEHSVSTEHLDNGCPLLSSPDAHSLDANKWIHRPCEPSMETQLTGKNQHTALPWENVDHTFREHKLAYRTANTISFCWNVWTSCKNQVRQYMFPQGAIQSLFQGICIKDDLYLCLVWMIVTLLSLSLFVIFDSESRSLDSAHWLAWNSWSSSLHQWVLGFQAWAITPAFNYFFQWIHRAFINKK